MADFDVQDAAFDAEGLVTAVGRIAQPAPGGIASLVVLQRAFEHQDFLAFGMGVGLKDGIGREPDQRHVLGAEPVQRQHRQALDQPGEPLGLAGVDHHALPVVGMELAQLDEEGAALVAPRRVAGAGRVAHVRSGGVVAVGIGKGAGENQELLAQTMLMMVETATRPKADEAGRPRHFVALAVKHAPLDAVGRRRHPLGLVGETHRALVKVRPNPHGVVSLPFPSARHRNGPCPSTAMPALSQKLYKRRNANVGNPGAGSKRSPLSIQLSHRDYGEGEPLVILHGLFGSARNWQTIARRLAGEGYRVVSVDLRNHGASPWTESMSFADMVDDLEALVERLDIGPAIVLGHSLGGKTAMLYALARPERVESLIVVDIAPVAYDHGYLNYVLAMQGIDLSRYERRAEIDAALTDAVPERDVRGFLLQNLVVRDKRLSWRLNLEAIGGAMDGLLGFPDVGDEEYEGRALFVRGETSDYIGRALEGAIAALFPQAEFAVVAGAGHRVHADRPDGFMDAVVGFLDSAYA